MVLHFIASIVFFEVNYSLFCSVAINRTAARLYPLSANRWCQTAFTYVLFHSRHSTVKMQIMSKGQFPPVLTRRTTTPFPVKKATATHDDTSHIDSKFNWNGNRLHNPPVHYSIYRKFAGRYTPRFWLGINLLQTSSVSGSIFTIYTMVYI